MLGPRRIVAAAAAAVLGAGLLTGTAAAQAPAKAPSPPSKVEFRYQERGVNGVVVGDKFTATWTAGSGGGKPVTGYRVGIATVKSYDGMKMIWGKTTWTQVGPNVRRMVWTEKTAPERSPDVCAAVWRATVVTVTASGTSSPAVSNFSGPQAGC